MRKISSVIIETIVKFFLYGFSSMMFFMYGLCVQTSVNEAISESCMPSAIERCIPMIMYVVAVLVVVCGVVDSVRVIVSWYKKSEEGDNANK